MPYETLKNIKPRKFQKDIFETCKEKNCLVVVPTGIGKTLIALMLTIERQKKYPGTKAVFLAPTRPLAEQHINSFKKQLPELFASMELFTGKVNAEKRKKLWQRADIVFSTPQCVSNDLKKGLYDLEDVSLLIEDEAHRCFKNYAYTYVAEKYKEQAKNHRILGLTASPGHDKEKIKKICSNLGVEAVEIRTRESEDVKEYLQDLEHETIKVEFPKDFEELKGKLKIIYDKKTDELKKRQLLFGVPNKKTLLDCQKRIFKAIGSGNKHFNLLVGASSCAMALKLQHAIELIETQTLYSVKEYFLKLFEQARLKQSKAVEKLVAMEEFNNAYIKLNEMLAKDVEHPKLKISKKIIEDEFKKNPKAKVMIFTQYRDTAARICKEMNFIKDINARVFVGQAKKKSARGSKAEESGLSQKEQQQLIFEFSQGLVNVLVCTSIGEEGLDLPSVEVVVFYEPVPSAIRTIQRRGRTARLVPGKLVVLVTKKTRDEGYYWVAFHKEKKMYKALDKIKNEFENSGEVISDYDKDKDKQEKLF